MDTLSVLSRLGECDHVLSSGRISLIRDCISIATSAKSTRPPAVSASPLKVARYLLRPAAVVAAALHPANPPAPVPGNFLLPIPLQNTLTRSSSFFSYTPPATSSGFGVTATSSPSAVTDSTNTGSSTGTQTSTSPTSSTSASGNFNAASSMRFSSLSTGSVVVIVLSAIAGVGVAAF